MTRRRRAALAVIAAVLAGCGGSSAPEASPAADLDPAAFDGQATTVDGEVVELAAYAESDLVVWFWAPW